MALLTREGFSGNNYDIVERIIDDAINGERRQGDEGRLSINKGPTHKSILRDAVGKI